MIKKVYTFFTLLTRKAFGVNASIFKQVNVPPSANFSNRQHQKKCKKISITYIIVEVGQLIKDSTFDTVMVSQNVLNREKYFNLNKILLIETISLLYKVLWEETAGRVL